MTLKSLGLLAAAALLLSPATSIACGPWIPMPYIVRNDSVFFAAPQLGFARELQAQLPESTPYQAVITADAPDASLGLIQSLQQAGVPEAEQQKLLGQYQAYRRLLNEVKSFREFPTDDYFRPKQDEAKKQAAYSALRDQLPPDKLPTEFQLYLNGARAFYLEDNVSAREYWTQLLALPATERPAQSVPAAYMLARIDTDWNSSPLYLRVRELTDAGFADPDGLAAASYGWEAQAQLRQRDYAGAVDLYLKQWKAGYDNVPASLKTVANRLWESGNNFQGQFTDLIQKDENVRAVLCADLLTRYDGTDTQKLRARFLNALPSPKTLSMAEAGRFALLEYQQNNLSAARLWLEYAAPSDALALWVRSKLLLRDGYIDEGRTLLVELLKDTDTDQPEWDRIDTQHAWAELGLLYLSKDSYAEAADCFLNSDSWLDLSYVLERVMTLDELKQWNSDHPQLETLTNDDRYPSDFNSRSLIGRRLMRNAQFEAALEYFIPEIRAQAEAYIRAMQQASNPELTPTLRAKYYWTAARITRDSGMDLFGTELDPDSYWSRGGYDWPHSMQERFEQRYMPDYDLNVPGHQEEARVEKSATLPNERFHYRYRAAQLAEIAAGLLPNNDEDAALIYCIAGSWLKGRDPYAADRFYKQLAIRCPQTALGQQANELHWFPPAEAITAEPFGG